MSKRITAGQAVQWSARNPDQAMLHFVNRGVVMESDNGGMTIVPVNAIDRFTVCNDGNVDESEDAQYHVRMRDCPPPFTEVCNMFGRGCYADVKPKTIVHLSYHDFQRFDGKMIEPESKVSSRDLRNISNAMDVDNQLEKELSRGRGHEFGF